MICFIEGPSFDGIENETNVVDTNAEDAEIIAKDAMDIAIKVVYLPKESRALVIAELEHGVIPGSEVLGETTWNESMKVINKSEVSIDPNVEWTGDVYTKKGEVVVDASLASEEIPTSSMRTTLQNLDKKEGVKGNYISAEKDLVILNEYGKEENLSLEKGMVKAFGQLNVYVTDHNVSDEIFTKACLRKGLDATDIKNIQTLRISGRIQGTEEDVGILQNILKKVGLTKGLKKDGTPDFLFGSGTVEDTESLCLILESSLEQEIEWDTFNDTLYPIPNGSYSLFHASIRNIKKTERYDPEQDPLKVFDNTLVAQGGSLKSGGNKFYSIGFLATIPEDILSKITNESTKETILSNRKLRLDCEQEWTNFQKQNPQYFQI